MNADIDSVLESTHRLDAQLQGFRFEAQAQEDVRRAALADLQSRLSAVTDAMARAEADNRTAVESVAQVEQICMDDFIRTSICLFDVISYW